MAIVGSDAGDLTEAQTRKAEQVIVSPEGAVLNVIIHDLDHAA